MITKQLFDFLKEEKYRLMVDMAKELHSKAEESDIKVRFNNIDKSEFYNVCREHELDGVVGAYAILLGLEIPDYWRSEYDTQKKRLTGLKGKAIEICEILNKNNIPMIILKNGGIMIGMIDNVAKCPMEDIDSLVSKKDFYRAHELLVQNGFVFKFRSEYEAEKLDEAYRDGSTEYYFIDADGQKMWFELAWRAVAGRWIRPDLELDTDTIISRSVFSGNTSARILSPEDNLMQVCIHTAKHSYVRAPGLRLHMDVDRIVAHENIDWNIFVEAVKRTHVKTSTYFSLYIPSVLFGTEIPEYVLNDLRPKNSKRILRLLSKAGLLYPKEEKFSKLGFLLFQASLYDKFGDILHVIYPGSQWMNERYNCKNSGDRIIKVIMRLFDLVGIRKKRG